MQGENLDRTGSILIAVMLATLVMHSLLWLGYVSSAIVFPFGLDYGEGSVWQQARLLLGPEMSSDLSHPPFVVFNYTPLLPLLVRGFGALGMDELYGGRMVALLALTTVCVLLGAITYRSLRDRLSWQDRFIGAFTSALVPLTFQPVQQWSYQMRSDMLAAALGTIGIYLAVGARGRVGVLCAAVLCFVLGVYTKQTELSAPAAALLVCAFIDFRATMIAAAFGLMVGGAAFLFLQIETHGGFWRHAFTYNVNRFQWRHVAGQFRDRLPDTAGLLATLLALGFLWHGEFGAHWRRLHDLRLRLRSSIEARTLITILAWLTFSTLMLITAGKHGASSNYFVEWLCVCSLPIGMATGFIWSRSFAKTPWMRFAALLIPALIAVQAVDRPIWVNDRTEDRSGLAAREKIVDLVRASDKPIVSEDLSLLMRADRTAPIEPSTLSEAAAVGTWNPEPFMDLVQHRAFGFFVTETPDARLTPEMFRVVEENYPNVEPVGPYLIRRPAN